MKNFKLLLASTAILSMGALSANATNPQKTMRVDIDLVVADNFKIETQMNFGRWIIPSNKSSVTFSIDDGGNVSSEDTTVTKMVDGEAGYTLGAPCDILELPESVSFDYTPRDTALATLSGIRAANDDPGVFGCNIYADSLIISDTGEGGIKSGNYQGYFTITAVLDPTTNP